MSQNASRAGCSTRRRHGAAGKVARPPAIVPALALLLTLTLVACAAQRPEPPAPQAIAGPAAAPDAGPSLLPEGTQWPFDEASGLAAPEGPSDWAAIPGEQAGAPPAWSPDGWDLSGVLPMQTPQAVGTPGITGPTPGATPAQTILVTDTIRLPILMYHHIQVLSPIAGATWRLLTVTPAAFEAQLAFLSKQGYHTIHFSDLIAYFDQGRPLPARPIILTFDDGWEDDYAMVYPILKKYGMEGTFFPPTNWVGTSKVTLTWPQVEEMDRGGMEFGSHTVSHRLLSNLGRAQALRELMLSKSILDSHLRRPVVALAYPGGSHNTLTMELAPQAGYGVALGVTPSIYQHRASRYELYRIGIPYSLTLDGFASILAGQVPRTAAPRSPAPRTATPGSAAPGKGQAGTPVPDKAQTPVPGATATPRPAH
jgi:peptidoglycan/xylan/chitin deacetylase (PgdA/CDA1 family)